MEAEELAGLLEGIKNHFKRGYHPDSIDLMWVKLSGYPSEAAKAVSRRLLVERHAVAYSCPTLDELDRMLREEAMRIQRKQQASEEQQEQRLRDPAYVSRQRSLWKNSLTPYSRARMQLLQDVPWGTPKERESLRAGLLKIAAEFPDRSEEIQEELTRYGGRGV